MELPSLGGMGEPDWAPLTGFRVAVTSARRAEELSALLRRRGATVTSAAAIAMVPLPDDDELRDHTEALIATPPDIVDRDHGHRAARLDRRRRRLGARRRADRRARHGAHRVPRTQGHRGAAGRRAARGVVAGVGVLARGAAVPASRAASPGLRIAVQLHGATDDWDPFPEFLDELRAAGAEVVPIRVYRWHPAPRDGAFDQLVAGIAERKFDAVSFTSAPAVAAMLMRAVELGVEDKVLSALRTDVHAMCVGPVTARPLVRLGVPTSAPERMRLGALARHITDELPLLQSTDRHGRGPRAGDPRHLRPGRRRGQGTVPRRAWRPSARWPCGPGTVVSRDDLLNALPGGGTDTHAVETAVLRLRTALGDKHIVSTVVKRGYRLAVDDDPVGVA